MKSHINKRKKDDGALAEILNNIAPHLSLKILFLAAIIVCVATIVQLNIGLGFGMTAGPLMALLDTSLVPLTVLALSSISAILGTMMTWRNIQFHDLGFAILGRLLGSFLAVGILFLLTNPQSFMIAFGLLTAFGLALSIGGWTFPFNKQTLTLAGFISGTMGTITSVGAPPLALIYQNQNPVPSRATLSSYFALGCILSIIVLMLSGLGTWQELAVSAMLFPATLIGVLLAKPLRPLVDKRYQLFLQWIAALAAITLIWRGLSG